MKKQIIQLAMAATTMLMSPMMAQNVGISPTGALPDNSAGLDVNFPNKGLLIPRVALTGANDAATIPSPATSLLVYNTGTGGLTPAGYYYNAGTPGAPKWVKLLITGTPSDAWLTTGNAGTTAGTHFLGTTDNVDLVFKTNNTERMRITNTGNVGIGTTTPGALLHTSLAPITGLPAAILTKNFNGITNDYAAFIGGTDAGFLNTGIYVMQKDNTSFNSANSYVFNVVVNNTSRMLVNGQGNVRIGTVNANTIAPPLADNPMIKMDVAGGYIRLGSFNADPAYTPQSPGSSFNSGVGALAISMNRNSGTSNVDFWNTTAHNQSAANQIQHRGFDWRRYNNAGAEELLMTLDGLGDLYIAGTLYQTSDKRVKSNFEKFDDNILNKVLMLKPMKYDKTNAAFENGNLVFTSNGNEKIKDFGFIAQEMYEVFPELVRKPKNENKELWAVDYSRLTVMLTKAIQEQQAIIEFQKKEIDNLKAEIDFIKSQLNANKQSSNR